MVLIAIRYNGLVKQTAKCIDAMKTELFQMEDSVVRMKERWNEVFEKGDPYYNPNLSLDALWMMKEDGYGTSCSVDVNI